MKLGELDDPIASFTYGVEINGIVVGWFTECNGLTFSRAVVPYQEGGVNDYVHQLPGGIKHSSITLNRGIADSSLWGWFREGLYDGQVKSHNVSIILFHVDRTEAQRWELIDVYPVKWTTSGTQSAGDQVAVESIEIGERRGGTDNEGAEQTSEEEEEKEEEEKDKEKHLKTLASKLYGLFRQELRWERERQGRSRG